jgi:hypothetical protein
VNRRGFFKSFGVLAAAASLSPTIFIPKFEPVRWKVIRMGSENPRWGITEFEVFIINQAPIFDDAILEDMKRIDQGTAWA